MAKKPKIDFTSLDKLVREKEAFILGADEDLFKNFNRIENRILSEVEKVVFSLTSEDGKPLLDEKNTATINSLNKTISEAIQGSDYPDNVGSYLKNFDTVKKYAYDTTGKFNDLTDKQLDKIINPIQKSVVDQTLTGLAGIGIDTNFSDPLKTGLYKSIVSGSTFKDLENYLKEYIISNETKVGNFKKYVTQISRDALNQYDGQINSKIAEEYNLNAYRYVGSLITDSRPQCRRWVTKGVILKDELPTEIAWAVSSGSGMIASTTPETFAVYRGGYNCRHSAIPFKLTKSQAEELGITPTETNKKAEDIKGVPPKDNTPNFSYGKETGLYPKGLETLILDNKVPDQVFIVSDDGTYKPNGQSAYYDIRADYVSLAVKGKNAYRMKDSPYYAKAVIVHEYGHRTHQTKGIIKSTRDIINSPDGWKHETDPNFKKSYDKTLKLLEDRIKNEKLLKSDFEPRSIFNKLCLDPVSGDILPEFKGFKRADLLEMTCAYTDVVEALTGGKLGFGHGKKYYNEKFGFGESNRYAEWFAHASENFYLGNPVFKKAFPELYEETISYYKREVYDKYNKP